MDFWNIEVEKNFFKKALSDSASPKKVFYFLEDRYLAYIPKGIATSKQTLQSRNSSIGQFTEKWCKDFFKPIAESNGLYAVNNVVCPELGLNSKSDADLAICTTNQSQQKPENIKLLFEIKMSIINNYELKENRIEFIGNYKSHKGCPSILRSDSMLKAIGKSINIRVSGPESAKIPIIILGNSPIKRHYCKKVDSLKQAGIVQKFISLYPEPIDDTDITSSDEKGFQTFKDYGSIKNYITKLIQSDINYISTMLPKDKLGNIIKISAQEHDDILRAEKFLELIRRY